MIRQSVQNRWVNLWLILINENSFSTNFFCCLSIISLVCEVVLFVNIFKFKVNRFMLFCHFYSFSPLIINFTVLICSLRSLLASWHQMLWIPTCWFAVWCFLRNIFCQVLWQVKLRIFCILVKTVSFLQLITELLVTHVFMSNVVFLSLQKILQLELSSLVHLLATGNRWSSFSTSWSTPLPWEHWHK